MGLTNLGKDLRWERNDDGGGHLLSFADPFFFLNFCVKERCDKHLKQAITNGSRL